MSKLSKDAFAIMAMCEKTKEPFGITVDPRNGCYAFAWAFKIKKEQAKREGYDKTHVRGMVMYDDNFNGCPHCGAKNFYICNIEDAYLYVLNKAATNFMKNDTISDNDQQKIDDYVNYLQLPVNNLPIQYQNSQISKLGQISILKKLQNGIMPTSNMPAPIMLGRGETVIWTYDGVSMYQEKTVKEYGGRRSGWSFRVMKGVTYHTGGTKIKPIEHTYMDCKGTGTLYITNKHLIFQSPTAAQKVPYTKMIGVTPYSDGIEVHRDGANANRLTFQGFDSWFLMNVISQIANM